MLRAGLPRHCHGRQNAEPCWPEENRMTIVPIGAGSQQQPRRLMVVPAHLGGSVQHFYHFFFGYMLPFVEHCQPLRGSHRFLLRDCGPMNGLLRQLDGFNLELVGLKLVLSSVVGSNPADGALARLIAPGFDHPESYRRDRFARMRRIWQALYGERIAAAAARWPQAASDRLMLVVDRAPPDPFYDSSLSENPGAGAARRSVPNMHEIAAAIAQHGETLVIRLEECDLFEQIALFSRAWRVVGQHGAGLAHMLWAPPGAVLIEILPNPQGLPVERLANVQYFKGICEALGLGWQAVMQQADHAAVQPTSVAQALAACA
jgi:hypothetical protein